MSLRYYDALETAKCYGRQRIPVLIACVLLATAAAGWALQTYQPTHPDPALEAWRWRTFAQLKGKGVRCMAEDGRGAMWFGVDEGALRYDGMEWRHYILPDGPGDTTAVRALSAGQNGGMYAATERGISHFDGTSWQRTFPDWTDMAWPVNALMRSADGSLWAGTAWGLLHLDGGLFVHGAPGCHLFY